MIQLQVMAEVHLESLNLVLLVQVELLQPRILVHLFEEMARRLDWRLEMMITLMMGMVDQLVALLRQDISESEAQLQGLTLAQRFEGMARK